MRYTLVLACVLLPWPAAGVVPEKAPAKEQAAESLLPADAIAYFRYDGYEPHRKAYEQTALAKAMRDDLGEFLEHLGMVIADSVGSSLKDKHPEQMQKLAGGWNRLMEYLWRHGLALGVEARPLPMGANPLPFIDVPARLRLTVVFPDGGLAKNRKTLVPFLDLIPGIKKKQVRQRTIHELSEGDLHLVWWQEGRHIVLVLGNDKIDGALDVVEGRRPSLAPSPLLKSITGFNDYETDIRGFVQVHKIVELMRAPTEGDSKLTMFKDWVARGLVFNQLGLTSLKSLKFHLGFDRQYQRSTILLDICEPKQRSGLARLVFAPVQFAPAELPPLPPDAASVRVSQVDWRVFHDVVKQLAALAGLQGLLGNGFFNLGPALVPPGPPPLKDGQAKEAAGPGLGVDIPKEILAHLDSMLVLYNSMSEGPFFLGQAAAIKVKDEKKLSQGLEKLVQGLVKMSGAAGLQLQKRTYRGVDMVGSSFALPIPVAPSYAIHKGWLVIGAFPQPVKGYILRSEGKYKVWQPPALVSEALALAKKKAGPNSKLAAVTITDPRPVTTVGLSLLPVVARYLAMAGVSFDVSKVPNAQALTEWQFPGVNVFYDDGDCLRWESHSSIEVPGDWMFFFMVPTFSGVF
jgi:hypothetical protein